MSDTDPSLPDVSTKETAKAKKDGVLGAISDAAGKQFLATDGNLAQEDAPRVIQGTGNVFHLAHILEYMPDRLAKVVAGKVEGEPALSEGQIASLLEVERSGKNRTDIVKVLCDQLGVKSPYEVTGAGPAWTNPVNRDLI